MTQFVLNKVRLEFCSALFLLKEYQVPLHWIRADSLQEGGACLSRQEVLAAWPEWGRLHLYLRWHS